MTGQDEEWCSTEDKDYCRETREEGRRSKTPQERRRRRQERVRVARGSTDGTDGDTGRTLAFDRQSTTERVLAVCAVHRRERSLS